MNTWIPSRKWFAAQAIALGALLTSAVDSGWSDAEWKLLIGWGVQAVVTYLLPNTDAPSRAVRRKPAHVESKSRRT